MSKLDKLKEKLEYFKEFGEHASDIVKGKVVESVAEDLPEIAIGGSKLLAVTSGNVFALLQLGNYINAAFSGQEYYKFSNAAETALSIAKIAGQMVVLGVDYHYGKKFFGH